MEIRKIVEVQRLTNNHVTNLEAIIRDLRHEIDEMGKTLTYLNGHEALVFKARRKLGQKFNEKYPRGSQERKRLKYKKESLLHPIRTMKNNSTEEGRNLRKGVLRSVIFICSMENCILTKWSIRRYPL